MNGYAHNSTMKTGKPLKRTPMNRGKGWHQQHGKRSRMKATPLAKVSPKRQPLVAKRAHESRIYFAQVRPCQAHVEEVCTGRARVWHEPKLRSRGGNAFNPDERMDVCHQCHNWIHENPKAATERGLMKSAYEPAEEGPMKLSNVAIFEAQASAAIGSDTAGSNRLLDAVTSNDWTPEAPPLPPGFADPEPLD